MIERCKAYLTNEEIVMKSAIAAYCIMIFSYYGLNIVLQDVFGIPGAVTAVIPYMLMMYKLIMTKYNFRERAIGVFLFALAGISMYCKRDTMLFTNVLVLLSMKNIDVDRLLHPLFWSALFGCLLVMVGSTMNIGLEISYTKVYRPEEGVITRYAFGYGHPNQFHLFMVRMMSLYVGVHYRKLNWKHMLMLAGFNWIVYLFSDSRTGMLVGFLLVILLILYRYGQRITQWKAWPSIMLLMEVAVIAFGFLAVKYYDKIGILYMFNRLFTGRLLLASEAIRGIGISWWGRTIGSEYICDNGMIHMWLTYGWVPTLIYWAATIGLYMKALKEKNQYLIILILVFTVYGLMESNVLDKVFRCVPMMYMSRLIFPTVQLEVHTRKGLST